MLNPMVQSDLVTYMGVTIVILFLQATNTIIVFEPKNLKRRETYESSHHQKMDFLTGRLFQKMSLMLT